MRRKIIVTGLMGLAAILVLSQPAAAIDGWGPRVGMTVNPDQVHFGAQLDAGYITNHLRFQPNFTVGVGNDATVWSVDFDAAYLFASVGNGWAPYVGGGPAINVVDHSNRANDSNFDSGLNLLGGVEHRLSGGTRFFTELKLGLLDSPDMRWTVGWTFTR
jgi:hypothetical protein